MKVTVDQDTCIGCGLCPETCPEVFEMKEDKAIAKVVEVPESECGCCRQAADECPVEAIVVE